jgi:hypothetical protein
VPAEPKAIARRLREQLRSRGLDLTYGRCFDIVARQLGHRDWNVLVARSTSAAVVRVDRSAEWTARNGDRKLGRLTAGSSCTAATTSSRSVWPAHAPRSPQPCCRRATRS